MQGLGTRELSKKWDKKTCRILELYPTGQICYERYELTLNGSLLLASGDIRHSAPV